MKVEQIGLRLIGYSPCAGHGFAMPLYGQSEGANTLYVARCSVAGDHHGIIEEFEPVDVDDQRRLPHGESVAVEIGGPWLDVFLWNDVAYIGSPKKLWAELAPFHPDLEARAPLSLLNLAVHAVRDEVATLAPTAFAFVRQRFGDAHARSWRRQFVRQQAEVALRQLLADQLDDEMFQSISLAEAKPDILTFDGPDPAVVTAISSEAAEHAIGRLKQLASFLGASLISAQDVASAEPAAKDEPATKAEPPIGLSDTTSPNRSGRDYASVLIIAEGKRASDIVSHLSTRSDRGMRSGDEDWEIVSRYRTTLPFSDGARAKSLILLVLDDEDQARTYLSQDLQQFLERQAEVGTLILLAPALPASRPSALFDDLRIGRGKLGGVHAILDTAIARSPFGLDKTKRSLDRRISEVLRLAIAATQLPVVRRELLERRPGEPVPILLVGRVWHQGERDALLERSIIRLGSEASWVGDDPKRSDPAVLFSLRISPDETDGHVYGARLIVEGRKRENRFPEFAGRVLALMIDRRNKRSFENERRIEQLPGLPIELTKVLRSPEHTAAFAVGSIFNDRLRLAVTGEVPSLDAVEQATRLGWRIARYTDGSTLRLLSENVDRPVTFPDEIDIGPIRSREKNRCLATRGVDQRDVIRISYDILSEWLDSLPAAERGPARRNARPIRSATRPQGEPETDHLFTREYVRGSEPAARKLLSLISSRGKKPKGFQAMKRSGDLAICWTPPSAGFQRYAMVDGAVPIVLVELREDEVPVQDLFVIDGDLAVPALFRSRVFAVWARATLPAASSWMARFSVLNTFGGFPIVDPFRIIGQAGNLAALVGASSLVSELALEVGHNIDRALGSRPAGSWKEAHRLGNETKAMQRLNEIVLNAYGLPEHADDIRILRRLQKLNAAIV